MPNSVEALIVIGLVLTPGYTCRWFYRQILKSQSRHSDIELILGTIALGVLSNALVFPLLGSRIIRYYLEGSFLDHRWWVLAWIVSTVLGAPIILGLLLGWAVQSDTKILGLFRLDAMSRRPDAWDAATDKKEGCYVIITLNNDKRIAGTFGRTSFASTDHGRQDLYIEKRWDLDDDGFLAEAAQPNDGLWLSRDSILTIEFIRANEGRST